MAHKNLIELGNLYVGTVIFALATSIIIIALTILTLLRVLSNKSFKFLRLNLYCILANNILDIVFTIQIGFYTSILPQDKFAEVVYYVLYGILKSLQYISLNVVLWNLTFKYWEISSSVVQIVSTLNMNIGATDSVADRSAQILKSRLVVK